MKSTKSSKQFVNAYRAKDNSSPVFSSFRLHPFLREPDSKTIPSEVTMIHAENLSPVG
jgi:hypothetical protein